jgi:hypothetical protein
MRLGAAALLAAICAAVPAAADEDSDLNLIPGAVQQSPAEAAPAPPANGKLFLENASSLYGTRGGLVVPFPPPGPLLWQNRTSLDGTYQWNLAPELTANFSDRLNLIEWNDSGFPTHKNPRNDFREGYLTWEPLTRAYLEAGRINVRNGVALGFNPTDFFKTNTIIDTASLDPSVIREDRLGVAMLRGQMIFSGGSASFAFAPKLQNPQPLTASVSGFDPRFDRTNSTDRFLATASFDVADLSPQALVYHDANQTRFGLNLSRTIGQSIVAYGEWAGGVQPDLIAAAVSYGKRTGTLPAAAPLLPPSSTAETFQNQLAIGASWTSAAKVTVNLEYHYNQAGFSGADWRRWFAIGGAPGAPPGVTNELWYIRAYAAGVQEPLSRHELFLRADWTDAFITNLELTGFTFISLIDGSSLSQVSASYYLSSAWTIGAYASATLGGPHTERGSLPQAHSVILQAVRYF